MRATGIVRKADELGRIVIRKETRKSLFINKGDSLEIFIENDTLFLKNILPVVLFVVIWIISQSLKEYMFVKNVVKI